MARYFVSMYTDGPATRWNVIDWDTQEWVRRFASKTDAQQYADAMNEKQPETSDIQLPYPTAGQPLKSTQAMRDRCRELSNGERDDYDRAVLCILDDLESLLRPCGECHLKPGERCDICGRLSLTGTP